MTGSHSIDLVESLTALSRRWHDANDSRPKPQPFHVSESPADAKLLVVKSDPDEEGAGVIVSPLALSLLTELGYAGAMQWKGDHSLLYLTPEGIAFWAAGDETRQARNRQHLIERLDERQGRTS